MKITIDFLTLIVRALILFPDLIHDSQNNELSFCIYLIESKFVYMKKLSTFLFASITVSSLSQSLTPTVVGSSGDFYTTTAASLSWTLGEIVTETYIGTNNQLTQGFQQPDIRFSIIEDQTKEITLNLYPNPTGSLVNLEIKNNDTPLSIIINDPSGKTIYTGKYLPQTVHQIDLSSFADGLYFMQIITESSQRIKTLKIEKL